MNAVSQYQIRELYGEYDTIRQLLLEFETRQTLLVKQLYQLMLQQAAPAPDQGEDAHPRPSLTPATGEAYLAQLTGGSYS
jgi:hypothetical protein